MKDKGGDRMIGWRVRFGVILPSVNTTTESEFCCCLPEGVTARYTRILHLRKFRQHVCFQVGMRQVFFVDAVSPRLMESQCWPAWNRPVNI
jgi:hypothetical protein